MDLINSYRAQRNWIKAHALIGSQDKSLALLAIRKAINLEPNEKKIPEYLELQGHIESSIGKLDLALQSFHRAIKIMRENRALFNRKETAELERRILEAIEEIEDRVET